MANAVAKGWASSLKAVSVRFSPTTSSPKGIAAVREMLRQLRTPLAGASDKLITDVQLGTSGSAVDVKLTFTSGKSISVPKEGLNMQALRALVEDNA
jgi:hypothetical protein